MTELQIQPTNRPNRFDVVDDKGFALFGGSKRKCQELIASIRFHGVYAEKCKDASLPEERRDSAAKLAGDLASDVAALLHKGGDKPTAEYWEGIAAHYLD